MSQASYAELSECGSQHKYDVAVGTATPNPPIVGDWLVMNLEVTFNQNVEINTLYINVLYPAS